MIRRGSRPTSLAVFVVQTHHGLSEERRQADNRHVGGDSRVGLDNRSLRPAQRRLLFYVFELIGILFDGRGMLRSNRHLLPALNVDPHYEEPEAHRFFPNEA